MNGSEITVLVFIGAIIAFIVWMIAAYKGKWETACIAIAVICGAFVAFAVMHILLRLEAGVPLSALGRSFGPVATYSFFAWLFHRRWKHIRMEKSGETVPDTAFNRWARAKQEMRYGSVA